MVVKISSVSSCTLMRSNMLIFPQGAFFRTCDDVVHNKSSGGGALLHIESAFSARKGSAQDFFVRACGSFPLAQKNIYLRVGRICHTNRFICLTRCISRGVWKPPTFHTKSCRCMLASPIRIALFMKRGIVCENLRQLPSHAEYICPFKYAHAWA